MNLLFGRDVVGECGVSRKKQAAFHWRRWLRAQLIVSAY